MKIRLTHIDTACMLIEINGFKILTDPTLDNSGKLYHHGFGSFSRKTENPALQNDTLNGIDLILLSHHQHKDNFDEKGKQLALAMPEKIISTKTASRAISGSTGLNDWESKTIHTPKVPGLKITATPARHHPWWVPEFFAGKVIGFVIEYDGQRDGVLYISGDTVYFKGVEQVAAKFKVDIGIFHLGGVQFRYLTGFGHYTMDSKDLLKAVKTLNPKLVVPIHYKGWTHFKESEASLRNAITTAKETNSKTAFLTPGVPTDIS